MPDLKELQQSLPEAVSTRLMEEANFLKTTFALDETQAATVERALFMGAGLCFKYMGEKEMESC